MKLRRLLLRTLPIAAILVALLIALFLVSGVQQVAEDGSTSWLEQGYVWVLVLTVLALLVLLWSIGSRLVMLARRVRSETPGARLAARWVRNFLILSLPPALIVYFFSAWFLSSTIDNWFDVETERALADSLALGQQFLDSRTLEVRNQLRETVAELQSLNDDEAMRQAMLARVRTNGPTELSLLDHDGTLRATANISSLTGLPERPGDYALLQVRERGEYAAAEPAADGVLHIRVMEAMPAVYPGDTPRILQAIYPLPADIAALTDSIESEYHRYQNVSYLRESLKQSFLLILSLVLLLTVLLAILAALNAARRMVAPLSRLSRATRNVAAGDLGQEVEAGERDEIGFLVNSFNDMTQALKAASLSAEHSRAELQAQGDYLETVLGNLSSGVVTLDASSHIIKVNNAGREILNLPPEALPSRTVAVPLHTLPQLAPHLQPLCEAIRHQKERGRKAWQQEIRLPLDDNARVLLVRASELHGGSEVDDDHGLVIVFDDVTVLNLAQREAAWAEVARRLAHEVKNPLTPIRLAAERLHMKLSSKLDAADGELLDRAANTIVTQVEALRTLVDAFGDYAREPVLSRAPVQLDDLITEVIALYQQGGGDVQFTSQLCPGPDGLTADAGRLRQLLHNLIRNAMEASTGGGVSIRIETSVIQVDERRWLQLEVQDSGPGFPQAVLDQPFEPYASGKPGGSGLGLAICRKIVSEHDGRIRLHNLPGGGAALTILLPLAQV